MKKAGAALLVASWLAAVGIAAADIIIDPPPMPQSPSDCKNGGWEVYGVFKNQGDCVSFVATDEKNQPDAICQNQGNSCVI